MVMLEAFQNLERSTLEFAPEVLVVPGVFCVVLGLCLWLGGMRWSRPTALVLGILAGCLWAFFLTGRQTAAFVSMAVVVGAFALFFNRAALVVAGAATVLIITLIVFAAPYLSKPGNLPYPQSKISTASERASKDISLVTESLEAAKIQFVFLGDLFGRAVSLVPFENILISVVAGMAVATAGYFMPQLIVAVTCSALGTTIIFFGMILLLLFKGVQPITHIHAKANLFGTAILAMVVFGSAVQLLLCSARDKKMAAKKLSRGEL
jgi:hypothetical protein